MNLQMRNMFTATNDIFRSPHTAEEGTGEGRMEEGGMGKERRKGVLFHLAFRTVRAMALGPGESGLEEIPAALLRCSC